MHSKFITLFLVLHIALTGISQFDFEYKFGFDFVEGIYLSYDEFKNNNPSVKHCRAIIRNNIYYTDFTGEKKIDELQGKVSNGGWVTYKEKEVWGICDDDQIYVYVDKKFHKITRIGALMYVTISSKDKANVINFGSGDMYVMPVNDSENAIYLIEFETGEFYLFTLKNFMNLIKKDTELYKEFMALNGKRQKKFHMRMYLEKFNDRNPVSFPDARF